MMAVELLDVLCRLPGATPLRRDHDHLWMDAPDIDVLAMARAMVEFGAYLITMTGVVIAGGETVVLYHYSLDGEPIIIAAHTHANTILSITPVTQAAEPCEREIYDLFCVRFCGYTSRKYLMQPPDVPKEF